MIIFIGLVILLLVRVSGTTINGNDLDYVDDSSSRGYNIYVQSLLLYNEGVCQLLLIERWFKLSCLRWDYNVPILKFHKYATFLSHDLIVSITGYHYLIRFNFKGVVNSMMPWADTLMLLSWSMTSLKLIRT